MSPDEAFELLGNETRVGILQRLAESEDPLRFSELYELVEYETASNFNYHLDKLVGHFVSKTADGYSLTQRGSRVYQAVVSGAVTEDPVIGPVQIDRECPYCDTPIHVSYWEERLERYCTNCEGLYGPETRFRTTIELADPARYGYLGYLNLPPAAVGGRHPRDILETALTWGFAELLIAGTGLCPRCAASLTATPTVCADHGEADPICPECHRRYAVHVEHECDNCDYKVIPPISWHLGHTKELMDLATDHGYNPLTDHWNWMWDFDEEVRSLDPFEARVTFDIDGEALEVTVDEGLSVIDVRRYTPADARDGRRPY